MEWTAGRLGLAASTCAKRVKSRGEAGLLRMAVAIRGMPGSEFEPRRPLQKETPSDRMVFSFWNLAAAVFVSDGVLSFLAKEGVPRSGAGHFPYLSPAASFLSAAKEKRKRNATKNYVFGFPCAALPAAYPACFHHANVVPHKFRLNIALSLLLGALPLLL